MYFHCVLDVSNTISELFILCNYLCIFAVGPSSYFLFNHLSCYTICGVLNFSYCIFYFSNLFEYFIYSLPLKTYIFISYQIHHIFISIKIRIENINLLHSSTAVGKNFTVKKNVHLRCQLFKK